MTVDPSVTAALERALDAEPGNVALRLHLASLLVIAGDPARALEHAQPVLAAEPDNAMALVTERNVYVLKWSGFGKKASKVLLKAELGSVEARVDGSAFPGRYLLIGDQKLWLALAGKIQANARAIAAAASAGSMTAQSA